MAGLGLGCHRLCCRGCPAPVVAGLGRPQAALETCRFVKLSAVLRCLRGFSSLIESLPMTTQALLLAFGAFSASCLALWAVRLANSDGATN